MIALFAGLVFAQNVRAQQVPLYSQYVLNSFLLNPAIAGSSGYTMFNVVAREQWIGIENSPKTYALSFHTRIMPNSYIKRRRPVKRKFNYGFTSGNVGMGAYVFSDRVGSLNRTGMRLSYAYHLSNKSDGSQISFGFSLLAYQLNFNDDKVILRDPDDEVWYTARESVFIPDADVGIYYSNPQMYVGLSVDQVMESAIKFGDTGFDQYKLDRNYYLYGGYDIEIDRKYILEPSLLVKVTENGAFQGDISLKVYYDMSYWLGLTYRTGDAMIAMAGLSFDKYVVGYAYDFSMSSIMRRSYGSHEFVFALRLGENSRRYRWLNR